MEMLFAGVACMSVGLLHERYAQQQLDRFDVMLPVVPEDFVKEVENGAPAVPAAPAAPAAPGTI